MRLRRSFHLRWANLVDPCGYWTHPHGIERVLLAWSHLVRTAYNYRHNGKSGPVDLLCKKPTCVNHSCVDPIASIEDLRERFRWVLLHSCESPLVTAWKAALDINMCDGECNIPGRHYKPMKPGAGFSCEDDVHKSLAKILSLKDVRLGVCLNSPHRGAKWLHGVEMYVNPNGRIAWLMRYGYRRDSSWWSVTLAVQEKDEPPLESLRRAMTRLEEVQE